MKVVLLIYKEMLASGSKFNPALRNTRVTCFHELLIKQIIKQKCSTGLMIRQMLQDIFYKLTHQFCLIEILNIAIIYFFL